MIRIEARGVERGEPSGGPEGLAFAMNLLEAWGHFVEGG